MKLCIVLSVVVALAAAKTLSHGLRRDSLRDTNEIIEMIHKYGYPATTITVTTEDGYILDLIKIAHGVKHRQDKTGPTKKPVLLMHGLMSSAEDFVYGGPTEGLAFILADKGHEVYLGNARGSMYGQRHTRLNPQKDSAFWRFCWHEIGVKDLPAIIDVILGQTSMNQILYVGHMEGATAFLVMASERPEYVSKVERVVTLGPIAFMRNSQNYLLKQITENYKSKSWVIKNVGQNMFKPSSELLSTAETKCVDNQENIQSVCQNSYFLMNGFDSEKWNETTVEQAIMHLPSGGSVREVLHFAQLLETGRFIKFTGEDRDITEVEDYDLTKVRVPIAVFYASKDTLSTVDDVKYLIEKLPRVYREELVSNMVNNLGMLYNNDVEVLYNKVSKALIETIEDMDMSYSL